MTVDDLVVNAWIEALWQAFVLARGERAAELRGDRRARLLDSRGLHPFSVLWGQVYACEQIIPQLADLRQLGEPICEPYVLRAVAYRDAERQFEDAVRAGEGNLWAHG